MALASRIRWLELSLVLDTWFGLGYRLFMRNDSILSIDSLIIIESGLRLDTLREWFFLEFALMVESLFFSELLRTVIIIFNIRDVATECGAVTILSFFGRVGQEVSRLSDNSTFFITVLFLNISSLIQMFEGRNNGLLDLFGGFEAGLVTSFQMAIFGLCSS